jgi:hypothetical protein
MRDECLHGCACVVAVCNRCLRHLHYVYTVCGGRIDYSIGPFVFLAVNSPEWQENGDVPCKWGSGYYFTNRGTSVLGTATVLRAGPLRIRVPVEDRYFLFSETSGPPLGPIQPPIQLARNKWSFTSAHPLCFHGADRENFHFTSKVDECSTPLHHGPVICSIRCELP